MESRRTSPDSTQPAAFQFATDDPGARTPWSAPVTYSVVVALLLLATIVRWLLDPLFGDRYPFVTYVLALFAIAYIGNARQTAIAAGLSLIGSWYLFMPDRYSFQLPNPLDAIGLGLN